MIGNASRAAVRTQLHNVPAHLLAPSVLIVVVLSMVSFAAQCVCSDALCTAFSCVRSDGDPSVVSPLLVCKDLKRHHVFLRLFSVHRSLSKFGLYLVSGT